MRGVRAKLKAVRRRKADGTIIWRARGFVPVRNPDGSWGRRRVEHGLAGNTAAARQAEVDGLNKGYEERASEAPLTFARAYLNYIETGHPVPMHAEKILNLIGVRNCSEIDDTLMVEIRKSIFAADAKPAYVNRHLYTPVNAILRMALGNRAPALTRPRGHKEVTPIEIPDKEWFRKLLPHLTPVTRALVTFLTVHGRRLGDALGRRPADFDPEAGTLIIGKTKNGEPMLVDLHPNVTELLLRMPDWREQRWLFRDGPNSPSNVRKDIAAACKAAGIAYFSPHEIGRHSFATRMLRAGYSLEYVRRAGGWKTIEMVSKRYGHLEHKEVTAAVHAVGDEFLGETGESGAKVGKASPTKRLKAPVKQ